MWHQDAHRLSSRRRTNVLSDKLALQGDGNGFHVLFCFLEFLQYRFSDSIFPFVFPHGSPSRVPECHHC